MVLSGARDFNLEQAADLSDYLGHTELEQEYFLTLIQLERAGNQRLKNHLRKRIDKIQKEANKIENRFEHDRKLTDEERAIFYSSWIYSAVRLFCSLSEDGKTTVQVVERFKISRLKAVEVLTFLKAAGLLIEDKDHFKMGVSRTYLEHGSPYLSRHHANWRLKSLQKSDLISDKELMFTFPMSLSKKDFEKIREEFAQLLKKVSGIVKDSPAEDIACLNIDLFWLES